jgi:hypothetical protein
MLHRCRFGAQGSRDCEINVSLAIALSQARELLWLDANRLAGGQSTGTSRFHPQELYTEILGILLYFQPFASTKGAGSTGKPIAVEGAKSK